MPRIELMIKTHPDWLKSIQEPNLLHEALAKGNVNMVELLIKNGINVNLKNESGTTALNLAVAHAAGRGIKHKKRKFFLHAKLD